MTEPELTDAPSAERADVDEDVEMRLARFHAALRTTSRVEQRSLLEFLR